jgi:hypothetical protein
MMPRIFIAAAATVAALAFAGCDREYVYQPTVATTSALSGRPASYYEIPPEAPHGYVQLATFGFAEIQSPGADDSKARALHVRMVVADNSDKPWHVDTREQLLSLPNFGESRPAFARADQGTAPVLEVPPGGKVTIDLYFPLPENMQKAKDLPAFDTIWKVQTADRVTTERTPFERLEVVPRYGYDYGYGYGWGPSYYYDPFYPSAAFIGVGTVPVYVNRPVVIHPGASPARQAAPPARQAAPPARR